MTSGNYSNAKGVKFFLKTLLAFMFIVSCASVISPDVVFRARVIGIKDGDTIEVLYEGRSLTVRLEHVDCPERSQPFSSNAKQFTSNFCFGKEAEIVSNGKYDRYRRLIAEVRVNGVSLNKKLVENGLAWHFKKYSSDRTYAVLEYQARLNKVGLWTDGYAVAPWEWRRRK